MLKKFIKLNKLLCEKLESLVPQSKSDIFQEYINQVVGYMKAKNGQTIVDVGGGRSFCLNEDDSRNVNAKIYTVDISVDEIKINELTKGRIISDVTQGMPFKEDKIDLIVSRSVLEHLQDVESFVAHSGKVLRANGVFIHLFPSRFAPFAIINQLLPKRLTKKILYLLVSGSRGRCGFRAFYNKCYYKAFLDLLKKHNFKVVDVHLGYYQSRYFSFFAPLYIISIIYEMAAMCFKAKNLAAYTLVVARREI